MDQIKITDLEVYYCAGVTDEERAQPQRLLLTVEMTADLTAAAISDRIQKTIDYHAVAQELLRFGHKRSWRLIEKLAVNLADFILAQFQPRTVTVEVKKFPIPQAAHVSVRVTRSLNR